MPRPLPVEYIDQFMHTKLVLACLTPYDDKENKYLGLLNQGMKMYCQRKMLFGNSYFDLFYYGSFFFINDMGAN